MITISEGALQWLASIETPPRRVLRLEPHANGRLGLMFGEPRHDDQVVQCDGHDVVHISRLLSTALDGATLTVSDATEDGRLVVEQQGVRQR